MSVTSVQQTLRGWAALEVAGDRRLRLLLVGAAFVAATALGAQVVGTLVVYTGGLSQLWIVTRQEPAALFAAGVAPFLVGDLLKVLIGSLVLRGIRSSSLGRF